MKVSENIFPQVLLTVGAVPGTPVAGSLAFYGKSGGGLFYKTAAGTEYELNVGPVAFADVTFKPTTLAGYGITDAVLTSSVDVEATANTVVLRSNNADINARLFRPNFGDQSTISGALAYRVNNGGDNYIRFCNAPSAVRTWMETYAGTYTPTMTGVANVDTVSAFASYYTRIGDIVTVSGRLNVDPTALALTQLRISLPIASNFTTTTQLSGIGSSLNESARILAASATDDALLEYTATSTANTGITFTFQYVIL